MLMSNSGDEHIVPGITVTSAGQSAVDPSLPDVLFDLALKLEQPTDLPNDVQHVLAAKRNSPPSKRANEMLRRWADQEGLKYLETA